MFDTPVEPVKSRIAITGLFLGLALSAILSFLQDKKSDLIYSFNHFKALIRSQNILKVSRKNEMDYKEDIDLLLISLLENKKLSSLNIIELTISKSENIRIFKKSLKEKFDNVNYIEIGDLIKFKDTENLILLVSNGLTKRSQINELNTKLDLLDKKLLGWIFID